MPKVVDDPNFVREDDGQRVVDFHYQKSPQYRTVHVDGAVGSVTARGLLAVTFYNERPVIPKRSSRPVLDETDRAVNLGDEEVQETLGGVMRQVETTLMLDVRASREFYQWLGQHVALLEDLMNVPEAQRIGTRLEEDDG